MSKYLSLEEIENFWPKGAPDIKNVPKYVEKYKDDLIVIKYGGNVLIERSVFNNFIEDISILNKLGLSIVVVHGGGPRIKRKLDKENIQTKFIDGLRVTDKKVIKIVEEVLIDFNVDIVSSLKKKGVVGVSINPKINNIINVIPDKEELGFVGTTLLILLFGYVLTRLLRLAAVSDSSFAGLSLLGIFGAWLVHVLVNIGMTAGVVPVTGIPLPFVSYGGTFLVMSWVAVALAVRLSYERI